MDELKTNEYSADEKMILDEYRSLKASGHGDLTIEISVKDGALVKLWKTEKKELSSVVRLREQEGGK